MPPTHGTTGRARNRSGSINVAPLATTSTPYIRKRNKIAGQFSPRLIEMLESPAYRVLSQSAHRVLSRIEIEQGHHAGRDNGRLPVTYQDFRAYGIDRHAISLAVRELEALGFIEVTERGRGGNAEFRSPNQFRLTYIPTQAEGPTHDWRRIETFEQAQAVLKSARKQNPGVGKRIVSVVESLTENPEVPVWKSHTTGQCGNPPPPSIVLLMPDCASPPSSKASPPPPARPPSQLNKLRLRLLSTAAGYDDRIRI